MRPSSHNRIEVLHGVNLDALGMRDPEHYGGQTLPELETRVKRFGRDLNLELAFFQTNSEGEYVERLHRLPDVADATILNPGAWTHYSYAIRDALEIASLPAVEVHISRTGSSGSPRRSRSADSTSSSSAISSGRGTRGRTSAPTCAG
jgi:3-dehydroquinate dehydratase-2